MWNGRAPARCGPLVLALAGGLLAAAVAAKEPGARLAASRDPASLLDTVFATLSSDAPGCGAALVRDGQIVEQGAHGLATIEQQVPIGAETVFDIGSVAKQFTAAIIVQLAGEGRLALGDSVRNLVPELPPFAAPVTIRHLLLHTSGVPDYVDLFPLAGVAYTTVVASDDALALLARQSRLDFAPGSEWAYSNSNYFLLALAAERASGRPLGELLATRIFAPAGMSSAVLLVRHTQVVPRRAHSYDAAPTGGFENAVYNWETLGDGAIQATAGDMARWVAFLMAPSGPGHALFDTLSVEGRLADGSGTGYGYGLVVRPYRGLRRVWHNGLAAGFRADVTIFPDQRTGTVVLCNRSDLNPGVLAQRIADVALAEEIAAQEAANGSNAGSGVTASAAAPGTPQDVAGGTVSSTEAQRWVGTYLDRGRGVARRITADGGKLVLSTGGAPLPLRPTASGDLQGSSVPVRLSLRAPARDGARILVETFPGRATREYVEVPPPADPAEYAAYAGTYASPALDVRWSVAQREGGLAARARVWTSKWQQLEPAFRDGFGGNGAPLMIFERDRSGAVTALTVWSRGVRGLRLERVPASASPD